MLPELGTDLWEAIAKRLDVVSFCAFGAACKSWKEICDRNKEDFLESKCPQVLLKSLNEIETYYLYDMPRSRNHMFQMINAFDKYFVGCTEGHMIFESKDHNVFLINPLNKHQICHSIPPSFLYLVDFDHDFIILATELSSKCHVLFTFSNVVKEAKLFNSGIGKWFTTRMDFISITDMTIFKNKLYFVTSIAIFGEFKINVVYRKFTWVPVKHIPRVDSPDLKLVVSNDQLFMVDFVPEKHLNMYKMNFDTMNWIKVEGLGDQALFLGGRGHSAIKKPGKWEYPSNCIYYLKDSSFGCYIYSMEAKLIHFIPFMGNSGEHVFALGWYYQDECMKVTYLDTVGDMPTT